MSDPYVGEIRMFAGNFAPAGWMLCDGQALPISENEVLFQLIGTTYGGDGQETFNLPNLQSRLPMHVGSSLQLGEQGGVESVTLTVAQIPSHTHTPLATTSNGNSTTPAASTWSNFPDGAVYNTTLGTPPSGSLNPAAIGSAGGSQPHDNMMPYLCVNFIISLFGIFPTQT